VRWKLKHLFNSQFCQKYFCQKLLKSANHSSSYSQLLLLKDTDIFQDSVATHLISGKSDSVITNFLLILRLMEL